MNNTIKLIPVKKVIEVYEFLAFFLKIFYYIFAIFFLWLYPIHILTNNQPFLPTESPIENTYILLKDKWGESILWLVIVYYIIRKIRYWIGTFLEHIMEKYLYYFEYIEIHYFKRYCIVKKSNGYYGVFDMLKIRFVILPQYTDIYYMGNSLYKCTKMSQTYIITQHNEIIHQQ